jgi:hypothetical protein
MHEEIDAVQVFSKHLGVWFNDAKKLFLRKFEKTGALILKRYLISCNKQKAEDNGNAYILVKGITKVEINFENLKYIKNL